MSTERRILVVDDLQDWQVILSGLLEDEGYCVDVAGSFNDAMTLLQAHKFDLAVLDVRLVEADDENIQGLELAQEIRKQWPTTKVIVVTSYDETEKVAQALRPGESGLPAADDYLSKSQTDQLVDVVKAALAKGEA